MESNDHFSQTPLSSLKLKVTIRWNFIANIMVREGSLSYTEGETGEGVLGGIGMQAYGM